MNTSGDAAEQVVRISLEGMEVAARISGAGAKNIAALIYTILKEEKKTRGKARLESMIRTGKKLKVFTVKKEDLKKFTKEAKHYGVLYCVLADRSNKDPMSQVDVLVREEDAPKVDRIVDRFEITAVDTAAIVQEAEKNREDKTIIDKTDTDRPEPEITTPGKDEKAKLLDELLGKPMQKEVNAPNPTVAKTDKSPLSEPISKMRCDTAEGITKKADKPSVKKELEKIKEERKEQKEENSNLRAKDKSQRTPKKKVNKTQHRPPKNKPKKLQEAR